MLLVTALQYVNENIKCKVINISMGIKMCANVQELYSICKKISDRGTFIISAFDNVGAISYPAAFDCVIGVDSSEDCLKVSDYEYIENSVINVRAKGGYHKILWLEPEYAIGYGSSYSCAYMTANILNMLSEMHPVSLEYLKEKLKTHSKKIYHSSSSSKDDYNDFFVPKDVVIFPVNKETHKETRIYLYILFGAVMGLRKSEIRGLKYSDIDYSRQTIHIKRQLGKDLSKGQSKLQPKTKTKQEIGLKTRSSDRELDIPDIVFNAIIEERKMYEVNRSRRSTTFQDLDYICCSSYGRPRSATYASSQYKALLRNNGLPDIRFHDLRHTYASMLLSEELSVKAVSNTLGNAKSIVTVDVYGDKARIIGDGTDAMRPTLEYVLPTEYITSREVGVLKKRVVYDSSIGFPEELADDIMECLLHKCA